MKELIEKLSLGITEYTKPEIEVSTEEISIRTEAEKTYKGSFKVICNNEKKLKGIVFSTISILTIENDQFIGTENIIRYKVCTDYANKGDEISGFINVVTNGGEVAIPVKITVDAQSADTAIGSIKNLFQFASLVQTSYDEAVKLFASSDFVRIFLDNDLKLSAVYSGLMGSGSVNMALEEFLVAASKKNKVQISISDTEKNYKGVEENYGDTITVSKNTWGYTEIKIETDGDFLHTDKKLLTGLDFAGNKYELSFYIDKNKLYVGKNFGSIKLTTPYQTLVCSIVVDNSSNVRSSSGEERQAVAGVMEAYIAFRLKKTDINKWIYKSESLISRARGIHDSTLLKLLSAHLSIAKGQDGDAVWLLENAAEELIERRDEETELYCYYLYIRALKNRDEEFTKEVIESIKERFENGQGGFRLLWMLFYLDAGYDRNISLKLLRIKEQYNLGMNSPLMYFEAISLFNEQPEMMRVLDDFEVQVLNFGLKNDCISRRLALWVSEIIRTERHFSPLMYKIMSGLYEKYEEDDIISGVCSLLIKCNMTSQKYFEWFERGIEREMKITGLYEYYMYTIDDDYEKQLPQIVLMYFAYNHSALPDEKTELLFANTVIHKDSIKTIYEAYRPQLEKYAADNILAERMGKFPAIIYKDILDKAMIGAEIAQKLPIVLNMYEISADEKNMQYVIIVHKETGEAKRYQIKNGRAYVSIYTEDAAVIFEDINGLRYVQAEHGIKRLLDMEEYLKLCYEISDDIKPLVLYFGDKYLMYRKNPEKSINVLKHMLQIEDLTESFRVMVEKEVIDYYSDNYDGESLDEYLLNISADNLGTPARTKIIEMSIIRGLYDRAYELMKKYGFYNIEPRRVFKCTTRLIEKCEDENALMEDDFLIKMAAFAFERGKYNKEVLEYLDVCYNGTTKELLNIWRASKDFQCEQRELEQKIIVQMLFTGAYVSKIDEVYASYEQKIPDTKVKKAYLFSKSYDYFVKEHLIEECVFKYIEKDMESGKNVNNDMCSLAYLKYMSEKESISDYRAGLCRDILYELAGAGKYFEFFKKFKKYFELPHSITDKTVVEYRTDPEHKVYIHYMASYEENENNEYVTAEMLPVCDGVFTYSFVLFYGENVMYYITEETQEESMVTESKNLSLTNIDFEEEKTHYGIINDILVCRDMKEEKTFEEMMKDYLLKRELVAAIFDIKN